MLHLFVIPYNFCNLSLSIPLLCFFFSLHNIFTIHAQDMVSCYPSFIVPRPYVTYMIRFVRWWFGWWLLIPYTRPPLKSQDMYCTALRQVWNAAASARELLTRIWDWEAPHIEGTLPPHTGINMRSGSPTSGRRSSPVRGGELRGSPLAPQIQLCLDRVRTGSVEGSVQVRRGVRPG